MQRFDVVQRLKAAPNDTKKYLGDWYVATLNVSILLKSSYFGS